MTDQALGAALTEAIALEASARKQWHAAPTRAESEAALLVVRHATAVIKSLKDWIAMRAQVLAQTT